MKKLMVPAIYLYSVLSLMLINFLHKLVQEIPSSMEKLGSGAPVNPAIITAIVLVISMILIMMRKKAGIYLGFIPAFWALIQEVVSHVILKHPISGVSWYPIFTTSQGILMLCFLILVLKENRKIS
jgi:hypothetical protein